MPDITMCEDEECPLKKQCYRFTATPNPYRQSYFADKVLKEDGSCDEFWPNDKANKNTFENMI